MAAEPRVVSLWREKNRQGLICSGLLLDGRHILTVNHAFADWKDNQPIYVRLIVDVEDDVEARLLQRHRERDAALLELTSAVRDPGFPALQTASPQSLDGQSARLLVIDPDTHGRSTPTNYSIASHDHATGEYVLSPENAKGHSGGVVEVDGRIIGLLSRRTQDDPLCRAVAMHLLWPWLQSSIGDQKREPDSPPNVSEFSMTQAYRVLLQKVQVRVRDKLATSSAKELASLWNPDPLSGFDPDDPASQIQDLINGLHVATQAASAHWKQSSAAELAAIKQDCRYLLSELVKLAVSPAAGDMAMHTVADAAPEQLYLTCEYSGTAEVVYCALWDLPHLLDRQGRDFGVSGDGAIRLDDLLPSGQGEDLRQEIIRKLWTMVMNEATPVRIDDRNYKRLVTRITRRHDRDNRVYLLVADAPHEGAVSQEYRQWAGQLHLGLALRGEGHCTHLLMDETELIDSAQEYLQLLETF